MARPTLSLAALALMLLAGQSHPAASPLPIGQSGPVGPVAYWRPAGTTTASRNSTSPKTLPVSVATHPDATRASLEASPSPTQAADQRQPTVCEARAYKWAAPSVLPLGYVATVTMTLQVICRDETMAYHQAIAIDGSGGEEDLYSARVRALDRVDWMNLPHRPLSRAAFVEFTSSARRVSPLTNDLETLWRYLRLVRGGTGTRIDLGISEAAELLRQHRGDIEPWRELAELVAVVTNGWPDDYCEAAARAAASASHDGIFVEPICATAECNMKCMKNIENGVASGGAKFVWYEPLLVPPANLRTLTITDTLPTIIRLVPDSVIPPPARQDPYARQLVWTYADVPSGQLITITYQVEPLELGHLRTSIEAIAYFEDTRSRVGSVSFPVPTIATIPETATSAPSATPTASPTASRTPLPCVTARPTTADPTPTSPGYYDAAAGLGGAALKSALNDIIDDHPYGHWGITWLRQAAVLDEDPSDPANVLTVFRNSSLPKEPDYGTGRLWWWIRVWPETYGYPRLGKNNIPRSDLHVLYPATPGYARDFELKAYDFCRGPCIERPVVGHADTPNWYVGEGPSGTYQVWAGRQGDIARALFYMDVRYDGVPHQDGSLEPDLILTDDRNAIKSSAGRTDVGYMGVLTTLIKWHLADPVTDRERRRNDLVYEAQGNRNPFIDHPEWVCSIWDHPDCPPATPMTCPSPTAPASRTPTATPDATSSRAPSATATAPRVTPRVAVDVCYLPQLENAR